MWSFTRESRENRRIDRELSKKLKSEKLQREADEWRTHKQLLEKAAAISSTVIVCHRDTWDFADSLAMSTRTRYAYHPPVENEIAELADGMREVRLSGPNLATLLTVTRKEQKAWDANSRDRAIAKRIYTAIAAVVDTVDTTSAGGKVPPVVIDAAPDADDTVSD